MNITRLLLQSLESEVNNDPLNVVLEVKTHQGGHLLPQKQDVLVGRKLPLDLQWQVHLHR